MSETTIHQLHCLRCGYRWFPQRPERPRVCARCKSYYWDVPKDGDNQLSDSESA